MRRLRRARSCGDGAAHGGDKPAVGLVLRGYAEQLRETGGTKIRGVYALKIALSALAEAAFHGISPLH